MFHICHKWRDLGLLTWIAVLYYFVLGHLICCYICYYLTPSDPIGYSWHLQAIYSQPKDTFVIFQLIPLQSTCLALSPETAHTDHFILHRQLVNISTPRFPNIIILLCHPFTISPLHRIVLLTLFLLFFHLILYTYSKRITSSPPQATTLVRTQPIHSIHLLQLQLQRSHQPPRLLL